MDNGDTNKNDDLLFEHRFPARPKELCQTRSSVRTALTKSGWCSDTVGDIVLAIDEACQNIIRHAYGEETDEEIVLQIRCEGEALVISLRDYAPKVSPDCMKSRDLEDIRPGGLGCHFIQQVMDEVSISPLSEDRGNVMRMVKRRK